MLSLREMGNCFANFWDQKIPHQALTFFKGLALGHSSCSGTYVGGTGFVGKEDTLQPQMQKGTIMEQYTVTGMSCAACSARVEKAVSKVEGVTACSVSLLTNSMGVEGTAKAAEIIAAVQAAGYGAELKGKAVEGQRSSSGEGAQTSTDALGSLADKETPVLKRRLIASLGFLAVLMYFSMGHSMWGWPLPEVLEQNPTAIALVQLLLTIVVMVINQKFFISGFKGLVHRAPNMDTLVALGSAAAFGYSTAVLFLMTDAQARGDGSLAMHYLHELYFESAAMILALITVGKMLEARSKGKTTDALKGLMKLAPQTAVLMRDGAEVQVPIEQVRKGDIFVVRPGENIPVDGIVLEGSSAVNEAALTGESIPVDKGSGDTVSAATLNQSGYLRCEATRVGEDTTLSKIIQMVSDAAATKAPIAKVADRVSGVFVPAVITIALVTIVVWLLAGESVGFALARGISVLVISCPCALGLATPVAIMVGNGMGAKNGILFKTAVSLEEMGKTQIVVLDKTGTITSGEPRVTDILPREGFSEKELLELAYVLEARSEHPLAKAILQEAESRGLSGQRKPDAEAMEPSRGREDVSRQPAGYGAPVTKQLTDFQALPGNGLKGMLDEKVLCGGNDTFISTQVEIPQEVRGQAQQLAESGKTPLFFAYDGRLCGVIAVADTMKEDSAQAVKELQGMGIQVVMLTGDNERTAKSIGAQVGVDQVIAGVLPEGKESAIRKLMEQGKVAMVGDGINDAPALTRADMGIAIGAGTDVAMDAADVVLMKSSLLDVPAAIRLSRATLRNIHQNLFWAFFYNSIGIPLAAGVFIPILGWQLNPMFGAAAMSLSSFCVVSNALRLNWFKLYVRNKQTKRLHSRHLVCNAKATESEYSEAEAERAKQEPGFGSRDCEDAKIKHKKTTEKEQKSMEKTMKIEGMMCGHCEARVKKVLEALDAVEAAVVSHEAGTAVVTLKAEISNEELKKVIEDQDYKVLDIQ